MMPGWLPRAKETLLIPSGPGGLFHLFVVLNDPAPIDGYPANMCALVCVCSTYPNVPFDATSELQVGSHPFVEHHSHIAYKHTRLEPAATLSQLVKSGVFRVHLPCADPPFSEIKAGLNASKFTKGAFKRLPI